jgi:hypothetical protein
MSKIIIDRNPSLKPNKKDKRRFFFIRLSLFIIVFPLTIPYSIILLLFNYPQTYKIIEDLIGSKILHIDTLFPYIFPHLFQKKKN